MSNRMNRVALLAVAFMLAGCEPETEISTGKFIVPPELSDCQFYDMKDTGGRRVLVVRCPHSETSARYTTSSGKSGQAEHRAVTVEE